MISFRAQLPSSYFILCVASLVIVHTSDSDGAGIVYDLVDHGVPDHTLSGTITVSDTAADDGLLDVSEVLSWQVEVSGSVVNFSIDDTVPRSSLVLIGDVQISPERILTPTTTDWLKHSERIVYHVLCIELCGVDPEDPSPGGSTWDYASTDHRRLTTVSYHSAFPDFEGVGQAVLGPDRLVHATVAVPEPSTFCLCLGLAGAGLAGWRNRTANRDPS